jgi:hypothetical protein
MTGYLLASLMPTIILTRDIFPCVWEGKKKQLTSTGWELTAVKFPRKNS